MSDKSRRVAVVTGGNRGIGLAVTRGLASEFDGDVFLAARDGGRGEAAAETLRQELGLDNVKSHQLDIGDGESVARLKRFLAEKYGGLDVLVNNAGTAFSGSSPEPFHVQAEETLRVNYWGTRRVCRELFPILRPGARVVNVSSLVGWLKKAMPEDTEPKRRLANPELTSEQVDALVGEFLAAAKAGDHVERGWPGSSYCVSKLAVSALSIAQQGELDLEDAAVNHVYPGEVRTDMNGRGDLTPEEGARSSVYAARLPAGTNVRGKYIWSDCTIREWA